jgi:hypothetical protein
LPSFRNLFFAGLFVGVSHGGFKSAWERADLRPMLHVVLAAMARMRERLLHNKEVK